MNDQFDCVGFGICAADYLCIVPAYPALDEKTEARQFSFQGGGPAATALVTLARLGSSTCFLGKVGNDVNGRFVQEQFQREGVDIRGLIIDEAMPTNQAFIWIDQRSGKKSIVLNSHGYRPVQIDELKTALIRRFNYLLIDGRDTEATFRLIEWAEEKGAQIVLDAGSPRAKMTELLRRVHYPVVSESFGASFFQTTEPKKIIDALLEFGATAAVVTLGARGCHAGDGRNYFHQPAFAVDVVDTTGAGDVFHGAFTFGLVQQWPLPRILKFASATAAIKCQSIGGRLGIPTIEKVNLFLDTH
ncbi:MAG: carbohydrate kinase family protein [Candidatus Zhuqueibacterota bacterium]